MSTKHWHPVQLVAPTYRPTQLGCCVRPDTHFASFSSPKPKFICMHACKHASTLQCFHNSVSPGINRSGVQCGDVPVRSVRQRDLLRQLPQRFYNTCRRSNLCRQLLGWVAILGWSACFGYGAGATVLGASCDCASSPLPLLLASGTLVCAHSRSNHQHVLCLSVSLAVCLPGFGGAGCLECAVGNWSAGGNASAPTTACQSCASGQTSPARSTSAARCFRKLIYSDSYFFEP